MITNIQRITTEISDINNLSTNLWYSGCRLFCNGCQNSQLKDFCAGMDIEEVRAQLKERRHFTDWLVHTGGNPIDSADLLLEIADYAKSLGYKQFLFCGYTEEEMVRLIGEERNKRLIRLIDYVKVGAYEENKDKDKFNCHEYHFATLNQMVIKSDTVNGRWESYYKYVPNAVISRFVVI